MTYKIENSIRYSGVFDKRTEQGIFLKLINAQGSHSTELINKLGKFFLGIR